MDSLSLAPGINSSYREKMDRNISAADYQSLIPKIVQLFTLGATLLCGVGGLALAETRIPGLATGKLDAELKGLVLIEELNCAACHPSDAALAARSKKAPRLSAIGSRMNPETIETFIRDPHGTKPGTTMPDVLARFGDEEKKATATALTHFLLSLKENKFSLQPPDAVAAKNGERLFHSRGCAACHSPRDAKGAELIPATSAPLGALEKKYSIQSLVEFLRQPHASRPSGRMPDMRLQGQDALNVSLTICCGIRGFPATLPTPMYRGQVWEGLASDEVQAERSRTGERFLRLESLGKIQQHTAIRYEGWLNIPARGAATRFSCK